MSKSKNGALVALALGGLVAAAVVSQSDRRPHHRMKEIEALYRQLQAAFAFKLPPLVECHRTANASSDGKVIRVNPSWFDGVVSVGCADGSCELQFVMGVLAHELGHHLNRMKRVVVDSHTEELLADRVAGAALRLLGVGMADFGHLLGRLSGHGSATHPDGRRRRDAIELGYYTMTA